MQILTSIAFEGYFRSFGGALRQHSWTYKRPILQKISYFLSSILNPLIAAAIATCVVNDLAVSCLVSSLNRRLLPSNCCVYVVSFTAIDRASRRFDVEMSLPHLFYTK